MTWIMKHKLAEECEIKLWETIYNMHSKGLSYDLIDLVVSEVILPNLETMKEAESALCEMDRDN